jgi:negative regulator of sigma E activity
MNSFIYNDKTLESYLCNELPDEEIAVLEDALLRDDEFFQRLETLEMDLIDRYLENEMTGEEKKRFEANFLSNPANQWKLEEARVFRESLELVRKKESSAREVTRVPFVNEGNFYSVRLPQFAAAAVILISVAIIAWLVIRSQSQNSNRLSTRGVRPPTPETGSIGSPTPQPREQPSPSPNNISSPERKREPLKEQWLYLRDEATGVMGPADDLHLTIPRGTETLRLRFELLDDALTKDVFRITIKDELGYPIFPSPGTLDVKPSSIRYRGLVRRAITVNVPVTLLKTGQRYRFEIADPHAQQTFVINRTRR